MENLVRVYENYVQNNTGREKVSSSSKSWKDYGDHNAAMIRAVERGLEGEPTKTVIIYRRNNRLEFKILNEFLYPSRIKKIPNVSKFFYIEDFMQGKTTCVWTIEKDGAIYQENMEIARYNSKTETISLQINVVGDPIELLKKEMCGEIVALGEFR